MTPLRILRPGPATLALGCAATAFGLRVFLLNGQSLWGDEAISLGRAIGTLAEIAADARHEGTLPPLYYLALHFWIQWAGTSEFALRFLSALEGTATAMFLFAALRVSAGSGAATAGALLAATSPFLVYYSQETRMYAQSAMMATASTALFLRLATHRGQNTARTYTAYVLVSAGAVLTHYFAGFVLLAHNAAVAALLLVQARRSRGSPSTLLPPATRTLASWSLSQIAILTLLAPWVVYVRQSLVVTALAVSRQSIRLDEIVETLLRVFSAGASVEAQTATTVGVAVAFLSIAALLLRPRQAAFWACALIVPVLATFYVSFTPHTGWPRYFIAAAPAWLALAAIGLTALMAPWRRTCVDTRSRARAILPAVMSLATMAIIAVGTITSLRGYYTDPRYARPDWRGALAMMAVESLPSTALVVSGPAWLPELDYYHRGVPARFDLPLTNLNDWPTVERTLAGIISSRTGVWHLKYYPPDQDFDALTEQWLANHAFRASGQWVENATVSYYSLPVAGPERSYRPGVTFGGIVRLNGVRIARAPDRDSEVLQLILEWQAIREPQADFVVFAHAVAQNGRLVGQRDSQPMSGFRPTSHWEPGEMITDRIGIRVPEGADSDHLRVRIGLYSPGNGQRLPAMGQGGESLGDSYYADAP